MGVSATVVEAAFALVLCLVAQEKSSLFEQTTNDLDLLPDQKLNLGYCRHGVGFYKFLSRRNLVAKMEIEITHGSFTGWVFSWFYLGALLSPFQTATGVGDSLFYIQNEHFVGNNV